MPSLIAIGGREYINEIKTRLRNDDAWSELVATPDLVERTRWGLSRIISSIDDQKARVREAGTGDTRWLKAVDSLRGYAVRRLDSLPAASEPVMSVTKETRAWKEFSATLAVVLDDYDPTALDNLQAPYGGLTAREWLLARDAKKGVKQ